MNNINFLNNNCNNNNNLNLFNNKNKLTGPTSLLSLSKESPILLIVHSAMSPLTSSSSSTSSSASTTPTSSPTTSSANTTPNSSLSPMFSPQHQQTQLDNLPQLQNDNGCDNAASFTLQQIKKQYNNNQPLPIHSISNGNSYILLDQSQSYMYQQQQQSQMVPSINGYINNNNNNSIQSNLNNVLIPTTTSTTSFFSSIIPKKNASELITSRSLLCKTPDCIVCENGPPPSFEKGQVPIWAQILHVALFALTESSKISTSKYPNTTGSPSLDNKSNHFPNGKRYFHLRDDIYEFINVHWDVICKRERIQNWKHTIGMTLSHYQNLFQNGYPIFQNTGYWCLKDDALNPYTSDFMDNSRKRKYSTKNTLQLQQHLQDQQQVKISKKQEKLLAQQQQKQLLQQQQQQQLLAAQQQQLQQKQQQFIMAQQQQLQLKQQFNYYNQSNNNSISNLISNNNNNNNNYNNKNQLSKSSGFGNGSLNILNDFDDDNENNCEFVFQPRNKRLNSSNSSFNVYRNNNNNNNNNVEDSRFSIGGLLSSDDEDNNNNINKNNNNLNFYISEKYKNISKDIFDCKNELKELQGEISILQNGLSPINNNCNNNIKPTSIILNHNNNNSFRPLSLASSSI